MGVEQYGLGTGVIVSIFYEIEVRGSVAQGNTRRPQKSAGPIAGRIKTLLGRFFTVKLDRRLRQSVATGFYRARGLVHEQQHRGDKRRQMPAQCYGTVDQDKARAFRVHDKSDSIRA